MRRDYRPLQFFFVFLAGLLIGKVCFNHSFSSLTFDLFNGQPSKLQAVINLVNSRYVDDVNIDSLTEKVIPNVLSLLDPHSNYSSARDRNDKERKIVGEFCGVGFEFSTIMDSVIVLYTTPNGPSAKAGILPGDNVMRIDTIDIQGPNSKSLASKYLKGEKGSDVQVSVMRQGVDSLVKIAITRDRIPLPSVPAAFMLDSLTGYVKISSFADSTYNEFMRKVLPLKEKGMRNLVIDLRDNGGGRVYAATCIASEFLNTNDTVFYTLDRDKTMTVFEDTVTNPKFKDINLVCLVNYNTASASELFTSAMQDHDRGVIVGLRTFGKGLVQTPIVLGDKSVVNLTTHRYYSPSGRFLQKDYKDYSNDYYNRVNSGELFSDTAFDFSKCQIFYTHNRRKVYSGIGVWPDVFVPKAVRDQDDITYKMDTAALYYRFAARKYNIMVQHDPSVKGNLEFVNQLFADDDRLLKSLVEFANNYDFRINLYKNRKELAENKAFMLSRVKAYAYRIIGDEDNYYRYLNDKSSELESAMQVFSDHQRYLSILARKE